MSAGRTLGIDPGERRVGVALSDSLGMIASPHLVIDRNREDAVARIRQMCEEFEVETIVVGLPVSLSGEEGAAAAAARDFGAKISQATSRNLVYYDERFTSVQAEQALLESGMGRQQRRETTDKVAAAMMLQAFLDATKSRDRSPDRNDEPSDY